MAFVGVFIAGAIFGGFFTLRSAARRPAAERALVATPTPTKSKAGSAGQGQAGALTGRIAPQVMRQLTQRLNPTPEQQKAIRPIVARAAEDMSRMSREHLAATTRTTERMYADVAAVLTPEQRTKLEQMRQEMLERVRREKEKRGEVPATADAMAKPGARQKTPPRNDKGGKTGP